MSYRIHTTGSLDIVPPLTWQELKGTPWLDPYDVVSRSFRTLARGVYVVTETEDVEYPEGILKRVTGVSVAVTDDWNGGVAGDLQGLVDAFPGHRFSGRLEAEGEENDDMSRIFVRNGLVTVMKPQIIWPEDPADEVTPRQETQEIPA